MTNTGIGAWVRYIHALQEDDAVARAAAFEEIKKAGGPWADPTRYRVWECRKVEYRGQRTPEVDEICKFRPYFPVKVAVPIWGNVIDELKRPFVVFVRRYEQGQWIVAGDSLDGCSRMIPPIRHGSNGPLDGYEWLRPLVVMGKRGWKVASKSVIGRNVTKDLDQPKVVCMSCYDDGSDWRYPVVYRGQGWRGEPVCCRCGKPLPLNPRGPIWNGWA
jgi:hypothetical protein